MDQRGHGDADKPETGYSVADYVADLAAFQDALGLGPCVLAGSSSGGYVAQHFAVEHPSRTLGLVLIGAPRSLRARPSFADEVERLSDPIDSHWIRSSLEWFPRYHDVPEAFLEARVEDLAKMPARAWKQALSGLLEADVPTESGSITAPTLIIEGAFDEWLPSDVGAALAAAIPRSRLVTYESTGHLVLWEQPERIAKDVAAFVADIAGGGTSNT